jgi:HD-like signal output (HDOD) protein
LLRFIGRLAINQAIQDLGGGLFWDGNESLSAWEVDNVGMTQAAAGAHLLRKWNFSEVVVRAVDAQEQPDLDASAEPLVQAVHFAARVLPSGIDRSFVESLENRPLDFPAGHPFVLAHHLTPEDANAVRIDAHNALLSIRGSV